MNRNVEGPSHRAESTDRTTLDGLLKYKDSPNAIGEDTIDRQIAELDQDISASPDDTIAADFGNTESVDAAMQRLVERGDRPGGWLTAVREAGERADTDDAKTLEDIFPYKNEEESTESGNRPAAETWPITSKVVGESVDQKAVDVDASTALDSARAAARAADAA